MCSWLPQKPDLGVPKSSPSLSQRVPAAFCALGEISQLARGTLGRVCGQRQETHTFRTSF